MNRYIMAWSLVDKMWMVVYAETFEDAMKKFDDGDYEFEYER